MALFLIRRYRARQRVAAATLNRQPLYKTMRALASVMVPAHGFVVGAAGLVSNRSGANSFKNQASTFFKSLVRGCLWAAAIAAGMLIYTAFVAKWKEKGYPTIPISALIAADQASSNAGPMRQSIPLAGAGGAQRQSQAANQGTRQTSLLDLDEYQG